MSTIEWFWAMKKPQVPLAQGLHVISIPLMRKNLQLTTDFPLKYVNGDIYFGKREVEAIFTTLHEYFQQDPRYPAKLRLKILRCISTLRQTVRSLQCQNPKRKSTAELLVLFSKGYQSIAELTAFMSFKGTVQMADVLEREVQLMLSKHIQGQEQFHDLFLLFSLPKDESLMFQEQKSMLRIAALARRGKAVKISLAKHTKAFAWMGIVMYEGVPYTEQHFAEELREASVRDAGARERILTAERKRQEHEVWKWIRQLKCSAREKQLLTQFREWIHLRTYVKDMTSYGMAATVPYLEQLARRARVRYRDVLYLAHTELPGLFGDARSRILTESRKRQQGWGMQIINGTITYYAAEDVCQIAENEQAVPVGVKGFPAFRGMVTARVVIVKNIQDLNRIQQGDILITHMTTTNFVPYLSKISAIVTDEGGITCHAAIISREMRIPCIIGTRLATKAFRDGDLVEVDANTGIVRKL